MSAHENERKAKDSRGRRNSPPRRTDHGTRTVEFPDGDGEVRFVADAEYRRVMKARGYDPDADLAEFMDAEDFTGAIRVKINGVSGMLCTT